jgi:serine/threonine-protein kinase
MGLVFEAEHLRLRQSVAIKFLRPEVLSRPEAIARFEREARASACIRGPHVVNVLDVDTDERGRPYMVMELLRGRDLEAELRARGALPIADAVDLVLQACAGVALAHARGIIHRDLKPSNLFLAEEAGKHVLKVLDFGISKVLMDAEFSLTSEAVTVGTPLYMSPEQMRAPGEVDGRTDIWSLGVILYELVAGEPPFRGTTTAAIAAIVAGVLPNLRDARPDVPETLERVMMTAIAGAPADRLPTTEALTAALVPFASADGVAGPFSVRPSEHDFALASHAMARTPSTPRVSEATDLLRFPRPSTTKGVGPRPARDALYTFVGTAFVGMSVAVAIMTVVPHASGTPRVHRPSPPAAAAREEPMARRDPAEKAIEASFPAAPGASPGPSPAQRRARGPCGDIPPVVSKSPSP